MSTVLTRYDVFLSHNNADKPAVQTLADRLRAAGLAPFLDRWHLIPGDPWQEGIEQALATSETVAVFVGPSGIGPWQNEEMRVALYDSAVRGKRVIPVLLPGADPQRVSPFLTRRTWVDFRAGPEDADALQRLIAGIQGQPSEAGGYLSPLDLAPPQRYFTPFQAPPLPTYFVPRPEAAEAIRTALLDARSDRPGVLAISAIHGLGGIGKTTLVAALAHDPAIRQRYPDGILWATLGQQPELFPRLLEWIQQLGDYAFRPTTLEGASSHLRTLLIDKACLLVVDDAWQREHVDHFLVGEPRSQVVITTRDAGLARKLRAHLHDLDVMTEAQALALFEGRLGTLSTSNGHEQAAALVRELGYLPLALELAAAQLESGRSWTELLAHFRSAHADLAILDLDEATRRDESLHICFALSLDSLAEEDRNAFVWFGVLPEDTIIGPAMAATLWEEIEAQARERLRRLRHKALLKPDGDDRYTLHDLLHDEAQSRLAQQMPLADAHAALLTRYAAHCQPCILPAVQTRCDQSPSEPIYRSPNLPSPVLWHTLPDDDYIHTRLTWHMEQARRLDAIHALLSEETIDGKNAWYYALERLSKTAVFIESTHIAWRHALMEESIGLQCRYALILASLNSQARNLAPDLLVALVEEKLWSASQALSYIRQIPVDARPIHALVERRPVVTLRASALAALVPSLPTPLLADALETARTIWQAESRSLVLATIALSWPELQKRSMALEAFADARSIQGASLWLRFQVHLASLLPSPWHLRILIRILDGRWPPDPISLRYQILVAIAPYVPARMHRILFARAKKNAESIRNDWQRLQTTTILASCLPPKEQMQVQSKCLAAAHAIEPARWRSEVLTFLANHLPDGQKESILLDALEAAKSIEDTALRLSTLVSVVPYISATRKQDILSEALVTAQAVSPETTRAKVLAGLATHLSDPQKHHILSEVFAEAQAVDSTEERVRRLAALAPYLPDDQQLQCLREALATVQSIGEPGLRLISLYSFIDYVPDALLAEALTAVRTVEDTWRSKFLIVLASRLPDSLLVEAMEIALMIQHPEAHCRAIAALATHLPDDQRSRVVTEALYVARTIQKTDSRSRAVAALAPNLPEVQRQHSLTEVLGEASTTKDAWTRALAIIVLAPHLTEAQLGRALDASRAISDPGPRAQALTAVASQLPTDISQQIMVEAFIAAQAIEDVGERSHALIALAPHLSENLLADALSAASSIDDEYRRTNALVAVIPHLPDHLAYNAVLAVQTIVDREWRSSVLDALASRLVHLPIDQRLCLTYELLSRLARRTRADLLSDLRALLPVIEALATPDDMAEIAQAIIDVGRWWP